MDAFDLRDLVLHGGSLSTVQIEKLTSAADYENPDVCREFSCMYHGERNAARDALRRLGATVCDGVVKIGE